MNDKNKLPLQIGIGVLVIIIFFAVVVYNRRGTDTGEEIVANIPAEETANTNTTASPTPSAIEPTGGTYKNGTYTASGTYTSPGGPEEISVTVTVANGVITNSTVNPEAENPTSLQFQKQFASGYKSFVMGKNLSDLKLSKVSGSSLTPIGFNNALEKIKAQAAS